MMKLSFVIVSYNVRAHLISCIESIYSSISGFSYEIIVIDNGSSDDSILHVRDRFPDVILIDHKTNRGFPAAVNAGMKCASGKFIFLLNPDTVFFDNSISGMLNFMEGEPSLTIVAPRLLNADHTVQDSAWKQQRPVHILLETFGIYATHLPLGKYFKPVQADTVAGAAMLFPRDLTDKTGYLDEDLFWMEDVDYCRRIRNAGGRIWYYPKCSLIHYRGQSSKQDIARSYSKQNLSKLDFFRKHDGALSVFFAAGFMLIFLLSRIIVFLLLSPIGYHDKLRAYRITFKDFMAYLYGRQSFPDQPLH